MFMLLNFIVKHAKVKRYEHCRLITFFFSHIHNYDCGQQFHAYNIVLEITTNTFHNNTITRMNNITFSFHQALIAIPLFHFPADIVLNCI